MLEVRVSGIDGERRTFEVDVDTIEAVLGDDASDGGDEVRDAFRVGEYIDTGRLRGTVEGMSLRSVRLRHQNGQVHTIPFGQVQSVTNFSRDWSVVKFNLHLEPTADIETVRKTIKRVGEELLDDPEIGAEFMQPLKMQGVVDVLQTALVVRCKFTATPLRPTYLQRQALRRQNN